MERRHWGIGGRAPCCGRCPQMKLLLYTVKFKALSLLIYILCTVCITIISVCWRLLWLPRKISAGFSGFHTLQKDNTVNKESEMANIIDIRPYLYKVGL